MNQYLFNLKQEAINENTSSEKLDKLADIPHLAYWVANNINTSAKTLEKLSETKDERVLKTIVSNPNTPLISYRNDIIII